MTGYLTSGWTSTPTTEQLAYLTIQRDLLLASLNVNSTTILAGASLTGVQNCACNGLSVVTTLGNAVAPFTNIAGLPAGASGPAACSANLIYNATSAATLQVGVDDGTSSNGVNKGKFCTANPALVTGSVAGTPGTTSSCKVYGSSTGSANTATATVATLSVASATVTAAGSGYDGATAVAVTANPTGATFDVFLSVSNIVPPQDATSSTIADSKVATGEIMVFPPLVTFNVPVAAGGVAATATPLMGIGGAAGTDIPTFPAAGSGYTAGDVLNVVGGNCVGSKVIVDAVDTAGKVTAYKAIAITTLTQPNRGTGCTAAGTFTTTGGTGTLATVAVTLKVVGYTLTNGGSGYSNADKPIVTFTVVGATGTVPTVKPTYAALAAAAGGITTKLFALTPTAGGSYTTVPTLSITGTAGSGATASALMGVESLAPGNGGGFYPTNPTVTITAPQVANGIQAVFFANLVNGAVTSYTKIQAGTGYTSVPAVTIAAPPSADSGLLCSPTPIAGLANAIPTAATVSSAAGSNCLPLGVDTFAKLPCSTPILATGGVLGLPTVGTCSVVSAFKPETNVTTTTCALMKQTFATSVTPSPPPKSPAASPPAATPSPVLPTCTYAGNYRMEAVGRAACGVEFPSYYGGSPSNQTLCSTQSIQLRTEKQLPKVDRATFELTSTGEIRTVRRGCAAGEAVWTPEGEKLRLLTTTTPKWKIEASAGDCNLVAIKSTATGTAAPYVSSPSPSGTQGCKSRQLFMTDKIYDTGRQLYRLRKF